MRGLCKWDINNEKSVQCRRVCSRHNESEYYRKAIQTRNDETTANIAITLIYQTDVFLRKLLERLQNDFVKNGGIKELMYKVRTAYRDKNK